ncbi:hypothetical protein RclHR1_07490001 [Rhizophagus clarus]|uniref:Kinase-like domain-containing protein n=1 Tax=Rhizophagus clarus TaxID=94130 RepID=A0A2Z6RWW5_9GLOM|nr:hypothetical protein RclHR1_07490001 [Rhizophagus clarus]GET00745.1 kinase-like domain-containing protein [Rhizophagus clarus]
MDNIRGELVADAYNRSYALIDFNIQDTPEKQFEFMRQNILADKSLSDDEKLEAIRHINLTSDSYNVINNEGAKRICENCQEECLAKSYCEQCIRNYLEQNFSNWTSDNNNIDNLIQACQLKTSDPEMIVEWIPYNNLENIKYLTKGGFSEIYIADWIDGSYIKWDNQEQQLIRNGTEKVILKKLENVENANRSWFDEGMSHLTISSKYGYIVKCYGLTRDTSDGNYMLVMQQMDTDLRKYLQQNYHNFTWKKRIDIIFDVTEALFRIHLGNAIHRDLHSGNILCYLSGQNFYISDLGFCGPVDRPINSIYGNLPYIAPEVISGKKTTFESDIYSIAMLMWEISSGQPPFINFKHDFDLALKIINGMRPTVIPGTPLEYKNLMEQCWDPDPTKRPNICYLWNEILKMSRSYYQNEDNEQQIVNNNVYIENYTNSNSTNSLIRNLSKVHIFENLPEPRNATEDEQKAYHSLQLGLSIPDKIEDIVSEQSVNQSKKNNFTITDNEIMGKYKRIYSEDENEDLTDNKSKKIKFTSNKVEFQYIQRNYINDDIDDDEISNNPNLHSEDQDELEIPEDGF